MVSKFETYKDGKWNSFIELKPGEIGYFSDVRMHEKVWYVVACAPDNSHTHIYRAKDEHVSKLGSSIMIPGKEVMKHVANLHAGSAPYRRLVKTTMNSSWRFISISHV